MGVFDELEAVGAHRIVGADRGGRRVVRERTHGQVSQIFEVSFRRSGRKVRAKYSDFDYHDARFVH